MKNQGFAYKLLYICGYLRLENSLLNAIFHYILLLWVVSPYYFNNCMRRTVVLYGFFVMFASDSKAVLSINLLPLPH